MPEYTMMDCIDGRVPLTEEQKRAREETYAHAGMVSDRLKKEWGQDKKPEVREASKHATGVPLPEQEDPKKIPAHQELSSVQKHEYFGDYANGSCLKGVMVFYFDVATMAPEKAEDYLKRWKDRINEKGFLDRLKAQDIDSLFIPVRQQETRVEYIKL